MKTKKVMNEKMYLFAYGMLMDPDLVGSMAPTAKAIGLATLSNHTLVFRDSGFANIEELKGEGVVGVLWEIDQTVLDRTDMMEGYPHFYDRKLEEVFTYEAVYTAIVYRMRTRGRKTQPNDATVNCISKGLEYFAHTI